MADAGAIISLLYLTFVKEKLNHSNSTPRVVNFPS